MIFGEITTLSDPLSVTVGVQGVGSFKTYQFWPLSNFVNFLFLPWKNVTKKERKIGKKHPKTTTTATRVWLLEYQMRMPKQNAPSKPGFETQSKLLYYIVSLITKWHNSFFDQIDIFQVKMIIAKLKPVT